jgi:hypothetical protein
VERLAVDAKPPGGLPQADLGGEPVDGLGDPAVLAVDARRRPAVALNGLRSSDTVPPNTP